MGDIPILDANKAKIAAEKYLKTQYGGDKIQKIEYSKVEIFKGAVKDVWEVEGETIIKTGKFERKTMRFRRGIIRFKLQIDSSNGDLIGYRK